MEYGSATHTDCSLEEFRKIVLDAVALSSSSERSGECSDGNIRLTISSGGSTTGRESIDGSTTRVDSGNESRVGLGHTAISLDKSRVLNFGDPFEGVFYRTEKEDSRTVFHFVSKVFYLRFRDKIMSDFSLSMNDDAIRCTTHFRGLKCDLRIDNSSSTVIVSGVGHTIWREDFFPVVARILFSQYVRLADSQVIDSYTNECADGRSRADECINLPTRDEPVADILKQPLSQEPLISSNIAYDLPVYTSTPIVNRIETQQDRNNMPPTNEIIKKIDHMEAEFRMVKQSVISNMEKQIQDLKSSVFDMIGKMKPDQTYAAVVQNSSKSSEGGLMFRKEAGNGAQHFTDTEDDKQQGSTCTADRSCNQSTDEGFCNNSNSELGSSQTYVKTVYPAARDEKATETAGQPVPVIITNRNIEPMQVAPKKIQQPSPFSSSPAARMETSSRGKLLLIGDSILNGINTKGLVKGVQKHAKGGATAKDLLDEISVYDMQNFEACIIYVGGNDCAKGTRVESFAETYDQLISLVKTRNPACKVYLSEIAPRGDVDVSSFNKCIEKSAKHWERQNVHRITNTYGYFLDKNYIPTNRYYNDDGIHLSHSGVKRLLDAMNTSINIVVDYEQCVFSNFKRHNQNGNMNIQPGYSRRNNGPSLKPGPPFKAFQPYQPGHGAARAPRFRNSRKQCFGCQMTGHILAECWNVR